MWEEAQWQSSSVLRTGSRVRISSSAPIDIQTYGSNLESASNGRERIRAVRFDASSQHPRTPNYLLESDQLGFDEDLLTSWQVFLRAEGKSPVTIKGYPASVGRLVAFPRAQGMPSLTNLTREHVAAWMDSRDPPPISPRRSILGIAGPARSTSG